jgi:hypothetical protein
LKLGLAAENKHKKVFSIMTIMVKAHNKSRSELSAMKVAELKTLIRKHNLDNAIRGYSVMKKADLVDALVKHSTGEKAAAKPAAKKRKLVVEAAREGSINLTNVQSMKVLHLSSKKVAASFLETNMATFNKRFKDGQPLKGWIIESGRSDKVPSAAAIATAAAVERKRKGKGK